MMIVSEMDLSLYMKKKKKKYMTARPVEANRWRRAGRAVAAENDDITLIGRL